MPAASRSAGSFGPGAAILGSAVCNSLIPVLIHLTAPDSNPFFFHAMWQILSVSALALWLSATRTRYLRDYPTVEPFCFKQHAFKPPAAKWLILASVGALDYGIFVWSTQLVTTAVSTTIYELWPIFLVYLIVRQRSRTIPDAGARPAMSKAHVALTALAAAGLLFMLGSQSIGDATSIVDIGFLPSTLGIALAALAAYLAGISVSSTLFYGEELYGILTANQLTKSEIVQLEQPDRNLLLWLTLMGRCISSTMTTVIGLGIGFVFALQNGKYLVFVSPRMAVGVVLLSAVGIGAGVLLRIGNITTAKYGVNALNFLAPFLSIMWLMPFGIDVPRFDLFLAGGTFLFLINIAIQMLPTDPRTPAGAGQPADDDSTDPN